MKIIKRSGSEVNFDIQKIIDAIGRQQRGRGG
ncbi:MAG: ATP cone domain-containing protein [Collinsella aerofaciens]